MAADRFPAAAFLLVLALLPAPLRAQTLTPIGGDPANSPLAVTPTLRSGLATQTTGTATAMGGLAAAPAPSAVPAAVQATSGLMPFGASLFVNPAPSMNATSNPNYVIQVGDTVDIRVWGGVTAEASAPVDTKGNVYLTGVGPLHVAGVTAGELQDHVQQEVSHNFTSNVQVYAVVDGTHQVGVFVTGFVKFPGRVLGMASDSALDYLVRAGGIDPSRMLFFGAIEPKKNVGRLIEAYLASKINTPLILVGKASWKSEPELRLLGDNVTRYHEQIDRQIFTTHSILRVEYASFPLLVSLIKGAKAVLFPSLYEGFGLPVLESMQLGTPTLTSTESSLLEVAGDAAAFVDPYDVRDIAGAIRALDEDADLRASLSEKGRKQAALFSADAYRKRLDDLYRRLL